MENPLVISPLIVSRIPLPMCKEGRCGFIYASDKSSLAKLLNALKSSGTKYDILPIWYSKKMVKNEQLRQESKNQSAADCSAKSKRAKRQR